MDPTSKVLRYSKIARDHTVLPATNMHHTCLYSVSIHQMAPSQLR